MRICIVYICAYIIVCMYVVYFRAYIILRAHATLRRGALLFLATFATFAAWFLSKPLFMLLPYLLPFCPFSTFAAVCAYLLPFLLLKRLQRSFYSVFRAVLSDPNFRRVLLYLLHRSILSHGSKHGKNAVIRGRGAPWGAGRAVRLTLRTIFYFLFPKFFFLENPLSPQCQTPFSLNLRP